MPKRERKPAQAACAVAAAASSGVRAKAAPPKPAGARWVKAHSGKRDAKGRLAPFGDAPAHFRPNLTPREMLVRGMHGGIYFNPLGGKPGVLYPRKRFPQARAYPLL
jgi:hypothetical protein